MLHYQEIGNMKGESALDHFDQLGTEVINVFDKLLNTLNYL